jgi:hypothetical protein
MHRVCARPKQTRSPLSDIDGAVKRERETLERYRSDLLVALAATEQSVSTFLPGSLEHGNAKARVTRLQNELRLIRGKLGAAKKHHNLGDLLIEVCRERVAAPEWQRIVTEARRRHDAQDALRAADPSQTARFTERE